MRAMQHHVTLHLVSKLRMPQWAQQRLTAVGFAPTPLRIGALSQRLRPLGQTVMVRFLPRECIKHILDVYLCFGSRATRPSTLNSRF